MTKGDAADLVEAYRSGTATAELCLTWQINRDTVYEQLHRAGITPNRLNRLRPEELAVASELYQSGLSLAAVGDRVGADAKTVRTALAQAGVPIRPRRGWPAKR